MSADPEDIVRVQPPYGPLAALLHNRDKVATGSPGKLIANDLTVVSGRGIARQWQLVAGLPIDHGEVVDEAAMLALHVDSAETAYPRWVVPGDSCLRTDDPGWRWYCIAGHGQSLSDWERRPLAGALASLAVAGHTHEVAGVAGLSTALSDLSTALSDLGTEVGECEPDLGAPDADGKILSSTAAGVRSWITPPSGGGVGGISEDLAVCAWAARVSQAGGTLGGSSVARAESLMTALRASGALPKIPLMLPLLGADITAALQPIVDRLRCSPLNAGFVDADFSEAVGLQGGSGKLVHLRVTPADLGLWECGGLGYWELSVPAGANCEVLGGYTASPDARYSLFLRTATPRQLFWWGNPSETNSGSTSEAAVNGHYYGQRSGSAAGSCVLYRDGVQVGAASLGADTAPNAAVIRITLMGHVFYDSRTVSSYHTGRCGLAYLTDGTLSSAEVAALHTALAGWMSSIGRV